VRAAFDQVDGSESVGRLQHSHPSRAVKKGSTGK
jgi:hypothetical protein